MHDVQHFIQRLRGQLDSHIGILTLCCARHTYQHVQGCDTFTISPACAAELLQDPLTESAAAAFEESASMMGPKTT